MPVAPTAFEHAFVSTSPDVPVEIATQPPTMRDADSFEELNARLDGILFSKNGDWFRKVVTHIGPSGTVWIDGELMQTEVWQERGVTLSKQAAQESTRSASIGGRSTNDGTTLEFDWFDGRTWWRRGIKPELDIQIMRRTTRDLEVTYTKADPDLSAAHQKMTAHREAVKPVASARKNQNQE